MQIGFIGLGKMGVNMMSRLTLGGHRVVAYDHDAEARKNIASSGSDATIVASLTNITDTLETPRVIWLMVPHTVVDSVIDQLLPNLTKGDTLIDGGNSHYKDTMRRFESLAARGIALVDAGISGGPDGAKNGACIMVGGDANIIQSVEVIFRDLAANGAYARVGPSGAGHFVKMIHNGIEYGMMQSIAEGFSIMKSSPFTLDLPVIAALFNRRSVIESRLIGWLEAAYAESGTELDGITGAVGHTGEGAWTRDTADEFGVDAPAIKSAVAFRTRSAEHPSYTGKILSALRKQFGGHRA